MIQNDSLAAKQVSTLRNLISGKQSFPKGKYCGLYPVLPPAQGRIAQGGLRMRNQYKLGRAAKPLVTYITVIKNNCPTLRRCMESVWNQTYDNIEYIVIDGASADGSLELIEDNAGYIDYFVSEPDSGIYSAMNKALKVASGDIINILNSDDWAERDAAAKAVNIYLNSGFDFLGGAGRAFHANGFAFEWLPRKIKLGSVFFGMPLAHQAVYATHNCYEVTGLYDESYRAAADFKWVLNAFTSGLDIALTHEWFANYSLDGISSDRELGLRERVRLIQEYFVSLSQEDARLLAETLHVTPVWHSSKISSVHEEVYRIFEKYSDDLLLIKTMGEALLMQCAELEKRYQRQPNLGLFTIPEGIQGKKIVFFGTGELSKRLLKIFTLKISYFVDNHAPKWDTCFQGLNVYNPIVLFEEDRDHLAIIVASQYFPEISKQLEMMGFEENIHFWNGMNCYG